MRGDVTMMQYSVKDLFQLQAELVDAKVDVAANKAGDRIIERIESLRAEMHEFRHDIIERLTAVETRLGMRNEMQSEIRNRTIEYAYKAGWLVLVAVISAIVSATFLYFHVNT